MTTKKSSVDKRKHIRYSAYLCFREKGYHLTSIDDVCSMANISKGSFYWHYGAKLDVFIDILETWAREVIDELLEQFEMATRSPDRIALLSKAFEREFHRARAIVPLWTEFSLLGRTDKEIQLSIGKFFRRARAAISEILRQTAGERLTEEEIKAASSIILGAYMGLVLQEFADPNTDAALWAQNFVGMLRILFHKSQLPPHTMDGTKDRLSEDKIEKILEGKDEIYKQSWQETRNLILESHAEVSEKWIEGWKATGYYQDGLICHVKCGEKNIELSFHHGTSLSDPLQLLKGQKKKRRHVLISEGRMPVGLKNLLQEAFVRTPK